MVDHVNGMRVEDVADHVHDKEDSVAHSIGEESIIVFVSLVTDATTKEP